MTVRRILVALVIGIMFAGCGGDYERGEHPIVRFSTLQVTDSSATLRLDIVDRGTKDYTTIGGMQVVWSEQPFSWDRPFEESDLIAEGEIDQESYEVTIDSLRPTTTYYVSTYHAHNEFVGGGGDFVVSSGEENFTFTTLPN